MKLLMIYADKFAYKTSKKTLEVVEAYEEDKQIEDVLVGFIQVETKLIKNLKWAAKKNDTNNIVLHSFAHLSLSKADPEITKLIFNNAEKRLEDTGYKMW
jgi:hypothetical protein